MMEGAVMEYIKAFLGMIVGGLVIVAVIFLFRLNEINTFQQEVNYQIERNGGLTTEAKEALNEYAEIQHNGYVSFSTDHNKPLEGKYTVNGDGEYVRNGKVVKFSGFTLVEVQYVDGNLHEVARGDLQQKYGDPIKYAIQRNIGGFGTSEKTQLKTSVLGESASRVRGTLNNGRQ